MFKALKSIAIISIALTAAACTNTAHTHGHVIKDHQLKQIRIGMHDRMEVAAIMGSPSSMSTFSDNRWYYMTEKTIDKALNPNILTERRLVTIEFNEKGRVTAISEKDAGAGKEVVRNETETPTHGQALGIVDQLIGNLGTGI